jgi:chromosomal replication initiation ATPase DnaA
MNNSKRFIKYLDSYDKDKQYDYMDYAIMMKNIQQDYYNSHIQNPYILNNNFINYNIKNSTTSINSSSHSETKEICVIDISFTNINDLINIIQTYPYDENKEYNIDLKSLHNIKPELIELDNMIGLTELKQSIFEQLLYFMQNLHIGEKSGDYKHTILFGPPGTGKTEIAKIIGKMYSKIGVLKKNIFKKVTRNDLIAGYLGQTAIKTKKVVDECIGGVLFIDEAYSLSNGDNGDSYSKECLDVLCECLSNYKNELMVIIAGYEDELNNTIFRVNQGLSSRFIWRFHIDIYNHKELLKIFKKITEDQGWNLHDEIDENWFLKNHKDFLNYGRDMETLLTCVKIAHGTRIYGNPEVEKKTINIFDMNNGYKKFKQNKNIKKSSVISTMYI